jgi:hypothetical protein
MPDGVNLTEDRPRHAVRSSGLRILAVGVIVVAALYFGRKVFVPLAVVIAEFRAGIARDAAAPQAA